MCYVFWLGRLQFLFLTIFSLYFCARMKRILIYVFVLMAILALFENCARIPGSISGGPRDETPPVFVSSVPPNYSTNFDANARRINITFDEFLQLRDVTNQFYSSPPMRRNPEILLFGKRVRVDLREPLLPDITYVFDFGSAITDLNEGNVLTGFNYVFSTGDHIDSLTFTGRVLNAFDLQPGGREDRTPTWVMLYDDLSDSVVFKRPPTYIARTDHLGFFTFSHIRPDTFLIFALRDIGGNLIFDLPNERIAFSDTLIVMDQRFFHCPDSMIFTSRNTPDSIKEMNPELIRVDIMLYMFEEEPSRQQRTAFERSESNRMRFVYSMPVDSIGINIVDYEPIEKWYELEISANRDTLDYWLIDTALINRRTLVVHLHSPRTDTLNNLIFTNDTLRLTYEPPRQAAVQRPRRGRQDDDDEPPPRIPLEMMTITPNIRNNGILDLNDRIQLTSSQPIRNIDPAMIILEEQFDTLKIAVPFTFTRDSVNIRRAFIDWNLKEDTRYFLTIDSMSFTSIYGVFNDSTGISFMTQREDFYSIIEITFDSVPGPLIVQALRGAREDLVRQVTLTPEQGNVATLDFLRPDNYILKVIYDRNGNGRWDTGNYLLRIQPERVEYFHEPEITTLSNMTVEIQWTLLGDD